MTSKIKPGKVGLTRAALYLRFSTGEQGQNAYTTIDAQREFLTPWAMQQGYTTVAEFADEARTGTNLKRPGYRSLLTAAQEKQFDVVIVTFMDRLGRGKQFTIAEYELGQAGARIVTALQTFSNDTGGYISQSARQMVDGIYPRLVSEWTTAKLAAMFAQGYHCGGRAPFGYRTVPIGMAATVDGKMPPKRLVPDDAAAEIVRECYRLAADGESKADVRRYLFDQTGEWWNYNRINRVLSSRVYRGVATWGQHVNEAAHLPLVDETLWQEAQTALAHGATETHFRVPRDSHYYLAGRVRCACGRTMSPYWAKGRGGKQYRYYQCMGKRTVECKGQVSADTLHQTVFVEAAAMARSPWRVRGVLEAARKLLPDLVEAKKDATRYRREAERLNRERDRFKAAIRVAPASALKTLTEQLGELETEVAANARRLVETEAAQVQTKAPTLEQCQSLLARLGELWGVATDEERKELAPLLVQSVTVQSGADKPTVTTDYYLLAATPDLRSLRGAVRLNGEEKGG